MDVREDGEAHGRAIRERAISGVQYRATIRRHRVQRAAASQAIVVPSLWPIASPFIPNINAVAKPLNHWIPLGKLGAPTNPPVIDLPQ